MPKTTEPQTHSCSFDDMQLKIGGLIQIEAPQQSALRASARLVGWLKGHSLMITVPQDESGRVVLADSEPVLCRAFTGKSAFAFQATAMKTLHQPFNYVHLSYPEKVEAVAVRGSPRCRVDLPATITANGKPALNGTILNIGLTGALIESAEALQSSLGPLQIALSFELHGVPVSLELSATMHSDKSPMAGGAQQRHQYGVVFGDLQPTQRLMLGGYIWYQMYEHPQTIV